MSINFAEYKVLSFDIYGTLINWEKGIYEALVERLGRNTLERVLGAASADALRHDILFLFNDEEKYLQREFGNLTYTSILKEVYLLICERLELQANLDDAIFFAESVSDWPAFKDTVAAMKILGKYYKLVAFSNVDDTSFAATLRGPLYGVRFDSVYTAEKIGSYKPSQDSFQYLLDHVKIDYKVGKEELLHVAHSLHHDHVPAKKIGMRPGVWIERRGERAVMAGDIDGLVKKGKVEFAATYKTLGEFAEAVDKSFKEGSLL